MIVIGAYPRTFDTRVWRLSHIGNASRAIDRLAPAQVGFHLLPFYPSSGDGGFAADYLDRVDHAVGTWEDIERICRIRPVLIDGIYNHVGYGNRCVQAALRAPSQYASIFHIYKEVATPALSPRGGTALRHKVVDGEGWHFWQTFGDNALDVRLERPLVMTKVAEHLDRLKRIGAWGVRLDAAAYYAKEPGVPQFHHPNAASLVRQISLLAKSRNLAITAQLDCDSRGLRYIEDPAMDGVTVVDYAYTAYLLLAILSGHCGSLAEHLNRTASIAHRLLRSPRNHDGVLLRPALVSETCKQELINAAVQGGHEVRVTNGTAYELNSPLASFCRTGVPEHHMWRRIEIGMLLTTACSSVSYLYLPSIVGFSSQVSMDSDPRSVNRMPISADYWSRFAASGRLRRVRRIVDFLSRTFDPPDGVDVRQLSVTLCGATALKVSRHDLGIHMVINFSSKVSISIPNVHDKSHILAAGRHKGELEPLGYVVWR